MDDDFRNDIDKMTQRLLDKARVAVASIKKIENPEERAFFEHKYKQAIADKLNINDFFNEVKERNA